MLGREWGRPRCCASWCAACGVRILATAHAYTLADMPRRELYREILAMGVFERVVEISVDSAGRRYAVREVGA